MIPFLEMADVAGDTKQLETKRDERMPLETQITFRMRLS